MNNIKEVLTVLDGCQGCFKDCKWNACVAPKNKNSISVNNLYNCNATKQIEKRWEKLNAK